MAVGEKLTYRQGDARLPVRWSEGLLDRAKGRWWRVEIRRLFDFSHHRQITCIRRARPRSPPRRMPNALSRPPWPFVSVRAANITGHLWNRIHEIHILGRVLLAINGEARQRCCPKWVVSYDVFL